jgi:hypothetical protein
MSEDNIIGIDKLKIAIKFYMDKLEASKLTYKKLIDELGFNVNDQVKLTKVIADLNNLLREADKINKPLESR